MLKCIVQLLLEIDGILRMVSQLEFGAKNFESKDLLFVAFQQKKPTSQKALHV